MVFGLFANDAEVKIELPSFSLNSGFSSQFFFDDVNKQEQQSFFGNQLRPTMNLNNQKNVEKTSRLSINGLYQNSQGKVVPLNQNYSSYDTDMLWLWLSLGVIGAGCLAMIIVFATM